MVPEASEKFEGSPALAVFLRKPGVMEVGVCAVTFLAYLSTLSVGSFYDDKPMITDNAGPKRSSTTAVFET
jgi:hypothetical protein